MTAQLTEHRRHPRADSAPTSAAEVLTAARRLAPAVAARAPEIEAVRRVPRDLLDQLVQAGCFRFLLPSSHGGCDATFDQALDLFEVLAEADASVGWVVMIGAGGWCDLAGMPRATFDELYPAERDTITAGAFNPSGSIVPTTGGYRVDGRWGFVSGCEHADWVYGNCLAGFVDGAPQLRLAVFRPDEVTIEDTWRVSGMCGTGSHHVRVDNVTVPEEWTHVPLSGDPCVDSRYVRVPLPPLLALAMAAVALGIARGAVADVRALASDKMPMLAAQPLATNPLFQFDLAAADTAVRAADALLHEHAEELALIAGSGDEATDEQRARLRAAAVWVVEQSAAVTLAAYRSGGGTSIYLDCPLQRRLRDVDALGQHFLVKRDTLTSAGALLAGQPIHVPVF